jgi:hypothetical protein
MGAVGIGVAAAIGSGRTVGIGALGAVGGGLGIGSVLLEAPPAAALLGLTDRPGVGLIRGD